MIVMINSYVPSCREAWSVLCKTRVSIVCCLHMKQKKQPQESAINNVFYQGSFFSVHDLLILYNKLLLLLDLRSAK